MWHVPIDAPPYIARTPVAPFNKKKTTPPEYGKLAHDAHRMYADSRLILRSKIRNAGWAYLPHLKKLDALIDEYSAMS